MTIYPGAKAAKAAWRNRKSPVAGIAEMIRRAKNPRNPARPIEELRAHQKFALRRMQDLPARARRRERLPESIDRSRYFPHSGDRESARRVRQVAAGSLKAENGLA